MRKKVYFIKVPMNFIQQFIFFGYLTFITLHMIKNAHRPLTTLIEITWVSSV